MKQFLSVIIPIYKIKEEYLRTCFDSLIAQDMDTFRVIAVDDGSPDKSGVICDEYAKKDSRFIIIHQENKGVSVARNRGIEEADTEWITFIDPDDWVEPDLVSKLYHAKEGHCADIFLYDYFQEFSEKQNVKHLKEKSGLLDNDWVTNLRISTFNYLTVNGHVHEYETNTVWNKMYRLKLIKDNRLCFEPNARKGQDVIFNAEGLQYTNRFYYIRKALYHYRYLQESVTNSFNPKVMYYNEVAFKHYERIIKKFDLSQEYWDAYYARVVTRLYSCMRLYYFQQENTMSMQEIKEELDKTLERYPYSVALDKVNDHQLTTTQRVFVFFLKKHQYGVIKILINMRLFVKKVKGMKLR